ncbi:MAG: 2-hydroxychromene-2-carboxylate isomerase [Archangium sp.]|nr:2-hydroxychromene-2-carboxylate isomerase [Archangium sp.]
MSPYSYLASTRVEAMVRGAGGAVEWRPCFLPGILRATGNRGPAELPAKLAHLLKDLNDWTDHLGLPRVRLPEPVPFLATQANRCALVALDEGRGASFITAMFRAIWRDGRSASDPAVLADVLTSEGLDAARVIALASSPAMKERLKAATDEAVRRGAYGVPAFFVGDELFMGNDRLEFVVRRLDRGTR